MTSTTTTTQTSTTKEASRTDREEFDKFTERDTHAEVDRFHEMDRKAFGLDDMHDDPCCHGHESWSPPSSPGVDLEDLAQVSEVSSFNDGCSHPSRG